MTALAMTLPLGRRAPQRVPRRDLLLGGADSLTLRLRLVAEDTPGSAPLNLEGIGPELRFVIWGDALGWDYGLPCSGHRRALASVLATVDPDDPAVAVISLAAGGIPASGHRLSYSVQLDYDGGYSLIAWGALQTFPSATLTNPTENLLSDGDQVLMDEGDQDLEV